MPDPVTDGLLFCGSPVDEHRVCLIEQILQRFRGLSRTELAATICEQLGWLRPSGKPKTVECRQWLEALEQRGVLALPQRRGGRPKGSTTDAGAATPPTVQLAERLEALRPIRLEAVAGAAAHAQWRALNGAAPKQVWLYPLAPDARQRLRGV